MSRQADVYSIPSMRVVLAPGGVARIGPFSSQAATTLKLLAGGTLELGGAPGAEPFNISGLVAIAGTVSFQTSQAVGNMYVMSSNEAFSANVSGFVYLYASGATCVVGVASGRTA